MTVKNRKPGPFAHRASADDVASHEPTFTRQQAPKLEDADLDPKTSGTGRRVTAATKADIRHSAAKPRNQQARPEADDVWVVLSTARGIVGNEIEMSRRCLDLLLLIGAQFGSVACDVASLLVPHNAARLGAALERSPVLPRSDADQAAFGALITLIGKGQGLKVLRTFNSRDFPKSVKG